MQETQTASSQAQQRLTERKDLWWLEPLLIGLGFAAFGIYGIFRALENNYYQFGPYLSPFYSPKLLSPFPWLSPAWLILWVPGLFRATCYYYRKAYYRAYFMDPPACSVGHAGGEKYAGESSFPLILQNIHRYAFYLAVIVLLVLWYDAIIAFFHDGGVHASLVSLIMLANVLFLSGYTFGCHAYRHLVGGRLDCFSCPSAKRHYSAWKFVTKLNEHHMFWAWISLFSVGLTDFYIRQVAIGACPEFPFF